LVEGAIAVVPVVRREVIGSIVGSQAVSRAPGQTVGALIEGVGTGLGEAGGAALSNALQLPDTLQWTDTKGNTDVRIRSSSPPPPTPEFYHGDILPK